MLQLLRCDRNRTFRYYIGILNRISFVNRHRSLRRDIQLSCSRILIGGSCSLRSIFRHRLLRCSLIVQLHCRLNWPNRCRLQPRSPRCLSPRLCDTPILRYVGSGTHGVQCLNDTAISTSLALINCAILIANSVLVNDKSRTIESDSPATIFLSSLGYLDPMLPAMPPGPRKPNVRSSSMHSWLIVVNTATHPTTSRPST